MTPTPHPESSSAPPTATVETRELITLCRQIGNMMEAGVDILRITRVLRSQTENPRLLEFFDNFDHDLRLGRSVADAMANAPELFSPFAVSLVQEGEERHDIAGSLFKIADFLQSEASIGEWAETAPAQEMATGVGSAPTIRPVTNSRRSVPTVDSSALLSALRESLERLFERTLRTLATLLLVESVIAAAVAAEVLQSQWWPALALLAAAGVCAAMRPAPLAPASLASASIGQETVAAPEARADEPPATPPAASGADMQTPPQRTPVGAAAPARAPGAAPAATATAATATAATATAPGVTPEETKVVWPTAEEENAAYSRVWQRPAPQEEQYD